MQSISRTLGGTIVRNSSRLSSRLATTTSIQKRLYATEAAQSTKKFSKWSMLKNGVKIGLVGGISYGCYEMYMQRHPSTQADVDPEKKTIVVLGSGWASTSFLKDIDTDHYNVVSCCVSS
ncbi:hypothetical protein G6F42_024756 [Rhizopus arrhizus]|nr:hypothetical protein G6F42_024756 [Rhizopus arrhizus]